MRRIYIIAEAGVNHNGSLKIAKRLVREAAASGADAVKFQTFKAERLLIKSAPKAQYQMETHGRQASQWDMIRQYELSDRAFEELRDECDRNRIEFLSTPFDEVSCQMLLQLGMQKIKIPSGEITNAPLLINAARSRSPIILSTGMATIREIEDALGVIAFGMLRPKNRFPKGDEARRLYKTPSALRALRKSVTLLHCVSEYPTPLEDVNLLAMHDLENRFHLPIGLSDHSSGIYIPVAAAALGAVAIEKHFTLDKSMEGPDHRASLNVEELRQMVIAIRQVEIALGDGKKKPVRSELKNRRAVRKSLVAAAKIKKGEVFTVLNLTAKRPGGGVSPMKFWDFIGKKAERSYEKDEPIQG